MPQTSHWLSDLFLCQPKALRGRNQFARECLQGCQSTGDVLITKSEAIKDHAQVERTRNQALDALDACFVKAVLREFLRIQVRATVQGTCSLTVIDDVCNLSVGVSQASQCEWDRLVDDLEISAACELLELNQGEVGLRSYRSP